MKFVCDNCQAKYQIGDDKVAGKTVRMKCRKCGYNIKVSPPGAEGGGDAAFPSSAAPSVDAPIPSAPVSQAVATAAPGQPKPWEEDDESTSIMNAPMRDAVAAMMAPVNKPAPQAAAPAPAPAAPRPGAPAPRPAPAGPARTPTVAPRPAATAAPHAPRPVPTATPRPTPAARPVTAALKQSGEHAAPVPHAAPTPAPPQPEYEWYVGIGGSPVGPIKVSVIRERAAAHEVDGDSLVWREGMGEWRPLRTVPELLDVLTVAQAAAPAPAPAPVASAPAPAPVPAAAAPAPAAPVPVAPLAAAPAPAAAAPAPAPATTPLHVVSDPFAAPKPAPSDVPKAPGVNGKSNGVHLNGGAGALHPDPLALDAGVAKAPVPADAPVKPDAAPAAAAALKPAVRSNVDIDPALEEALIPRRGRGGANPMAWAFVAAAAVFGGVAAYVIFLKPPPQPQIVVVQGAAPVTAPVASTTLADPAHVEVGDPVTAPSSAARPALGKPWPKSSGAAAAPAAPAAPLDTSGIVNNVPGPQAQAPSGPSPSGGQLSAGEINGVVTANQPRIRRKCWQPALDGAPPNGPKSARINVNLTIGPNGNVESASASGSERDFPGLASCVQSTVQTWKFPASGGSTPVQVPFHFAGQ